MRDWLFILTALSCSALTARANDSTAELGAGGLNLVHNDAVSLLSEDLYVSTAEIRIKYRFKNITAAPVTFLVAFPLPAIDATTPEDTNFQLPAPEKDNFVNFQVKVDGIPVTPSMAQRITALDIDRTAEVKALGLPLNPLAAKLDEILKALPTDKQAEMKRIGLMTQDFASWKLETTFYWPQTFIPGKELVVEHRYQPVFGSGFFTLGTPNMPPHFAKYCVDQEFAQAARAKLASLTDSKMQYLNEKRVSYILTTANNWAGPIKAFRLVVDKGEPDALVTFCARGVKKISPTQFEMKAIDYLPDRELDVMFVQKFTEQ